ncbi:hypothetical protein HY468_03270 [Candidatus Roizmanbacteria bacterium]|nr:hypothetical protein [Candidatus Roizmanbacteria bacterium]
MLKEPEAFELDNPFRIYGSADFEKLKQDHYIYRINPSGYPEFLHVPTQFIPQALEMRYPVDQTVPYQRNIQRVLDGFDTARKKRIHPLIELEPRRIMFPLMTFRFRRSQMVVMASAFIDMVNGKGNIARLQKPSPYLFDIFRVPTANYCNALFPEQVAGYAQAALDQMQNTQETYMRLPDRNLSCLLAQQLYQLVEDMRSERLGIMHYSKQ